MRRFLINATRLFVCPIGLLVISVSFPIVWLRVRRRLHRGDLPRVLWGPTSLVNNIHWARAVRTQAYVSDSAIYTVEENYNAKDFDHQLSIKFRHIRRLFLIPYLSFAWATWNYDIFHFCFNVEGYLHQTPLRYLEFPILRLLGKKIVASPYGSDVQMPSMISGKYEHSIATQAQADEAYVWRNIQHTIKYADFVRVGGDLPEYLPNFDLAFQAIAIDLNDWHQPAHCTNTHPVIVHATNHRHLKGTDSLLKACDDLESEGYQFDLELVERTKNEDARQSYETADIIADQFIIGTYGMFAVEAMALGKPVLGHLRENLFEFNPHWAECPILNTTPDSLKEHLRMLLEKPELREKLGRKSREYVEKYHSYDYIGGILDKVYRKLWYDEEMDWTQYPVRAWSGTNPLFDKQRALRT